MSSDDINQRIIDVKERLHTCERIHDKLTRIEQSLRSHRAHLIELEKELKKEGRDVKKLEGLSLTGLFYTILGSKDEQADQEQQEYLSAKLRYDQTQSTITSLETEQSVLNSQLARLGDPREDYRALNGLKERHTLDARSTGFAELDPLVDQLADLQWQEKELTEAIQAGNSAQSALMDAIDALSSASNWGVWDMLGGGLLATAVKHSRIDDARDSIHRVQTLLEHFKREMAEVQYSLDAAHEIDLSTFDTFADYFFDGLIVDWVIQSRINDSLQATQRMEVTIQMLTANLQRALGGIQRRVADLQEQRMLIIENG